MTVGAIKFNRTFGLGGIAALLFVILFVTGLILRFSYIPTVEHAYDSVLNLQRNTVFGQFIRNLHHISAKLMMVVVFLHLLRTYYSQSIFGKRAENWFYGLIMLFMVVASSFTGYLLPWDQLSYWAVTVITQIIDYIPVIGHSLANGIRGGDTVNANTLLNFYNLHTGIIPIVFIFLMSMHFWLVRKAGGVALPDKKEVKKVNVIPHLVWMELMVAAIVIAAIFIFSAFYHAPLLSQANPMQSPDPSKAPWYFLGAQELLLHVHPVFSAFIIPLLAGGFFVYLPYFRYKQINEGVWFNSALGKKMTISSIVFSCAFTFVLIYTLDHFLHFDLWLSSWGSWITTGVIPVLLYIIPNGVYLWYWRNKHKAQSQEIIMSITTIFTSSYIMMLLIAFFLRGEGMLMMI